MLLLVLIVLTFSSTFSKGQSNNACKTFEDYANYTVNKNCWYNPDMALETPGLLKKYIGKYESYKITTEDGYILTMFRMPRENPKGVILLQHSLGVDSRMWLYEGKESLAYYLWNAGYDVWMNSHRGTLFSQGHVKLSYSSPSFWNYSFHEVGVYDIPAQIRHIRKSTNSKIIYIGHSFGSTSGLIYASMKAREAKEAVKTFIFMATPAYFKHATSVMTLFIPYRKLLQTLVESLHLGNALFYLPVAMILKMVNRVLPILLPVINIIVCLISGLTMEETDPAILNLDFAIVIKSFSWKILLHYLQLLETKTRFQMFDYGKERNLKYYGSEIPAAYPLMNVSVPVYFLSSDNDSLTTLLDSDLLIQDLPKNVTKYGHWKISQLNHMQYVLGKHAKEIIFKKLLQFVNEIDVK